MKKVKSFFKSWEFFLICLMALVCIVFNLKDSANLAAGLAKKDVFNFANIIKSLRPYMLYSFMTLGMMLILALGDMDISVGAIATLSVVVLAVLYRALTVGGMGNGLAFALSIAACVLGGVSVTGGYGKITGVVIGAVMIALIDNAIPMLGIGNSMITEFVKGILLLFAILLNVILQRIANKQDLARRNI